MVLTAARRWFSARASAASTLRVGFVGLIGLPLRGGAGGGGFGGGVFEETAEIFAFSGETFELAAGGSPGRRCRNSVDFPGRRCGLCWS